MFLFMLLALVLGAACGRLPNRQRQFVRLALGCAVVFSILVGNAAACDTVVQRERVVFQYRQPERIIVKEVVDDCPIQRERVILRQESSYDRPAVILRQQAGYQRERIILEQSAGYGYQRPAIVLQQNAGYGREAIILRQRQDYRAAAVQLNINNGYQRQGLGLRDRFQDRRQTEIIRERSVQRIQRSSY